MTAAATRWRSCVEDWRRSGERVTAYARSHGVVPSTFRGWIRRLEQVERATPRFVQLVPRRALVPSLAGETTSDAALVIELGAACVRVGRGFDRELLAEVVSALREARS